MKYRSFLLSAGGGISPESRREAPPSDRATVFIGLGGTGIECLRSVKTRISERFTPDSFRDGLPEYERIRFLAVDSDRMSFDGAEKRKGLLPLSQNESIFIGAADVSGLAGFAARTTDPAFSWFDKGINVPPGADTACGIRQLGRLLFMNRSAELRSRLQAELFHALAGVPDRRINVHILSGLCGGTGSGCFLDLCYLVRSIVPDRSELSGYFFLPDVELSRPFLNEDTAKALKRNGYASLKELDYFMNLPGNGGGFRQVYPGSFSAAWDRPPVDVCHLIGADGGDPHARDRAIHTVTEYVTEQLSRDSDPHGYRAKLSHAVMSANMQKTSGAGAYYCSVGTATAALPRREMHTYLASGLFMRFASAAENIPSAGEALRFSTAALTGEAGSLSDAYNALHRELLLDTEGWYDPFPRERLRIRDFDEARFDAHYAQQSAQKKSVMEINAMHLMDESSSGSLVGRLRSRLDGAVCDFTQGPFFAASVLTQTLPGLIGELLELGAKSREHELARFREFTAEYREACESFYQRPRASTLESVRQCRRRLEGCGVSLYAHELLGRILLRLRGFPEAEYTDRYKWLAGSMDGLLETFRENWVTLSDVSAFYDDPFTLPLVSLNEMRPVLDGELRALDIPAVFGSFMKLMLHSAEAWRPENEALLCRSVSSFLEVLFRDFFSSSVTERLLRIKYGQSLSDSELADRLYSEYLPQLSELARPMLRRDPTLFDSGSTVRLDSLSFPDPSAPMRMAAERMQQGPCPGLKIQRRPDDRIRFIRTELALPLAPVIRCFDWEQVYCSGQIPGLHSDGEWNALPSPVPYSLLSRLPDTPGQILARASADAALYDEAVRRGVIDREGYVCAPAEYELGRRSILAGLCDECGERIRSAFSEGDAAALEDAKEKMLAAAELRLERIGLHLPNEGIQADGIAAIVRRDRFVSSPVIRNKVKSILGTLAAIGDRVSFLAQKAEERRECILTDIERRKSFFGALFSGVLTVRGTGIEYRSGDACCTVLSDMSGAFPYSDIPPYQAYLSFCKLSAEERSEIRSRFEHRINDAWEELASALEAGTRFLSEDRFRDWLYLAKYKYREGEIVRFLCELYNDLQRFRMVYVG